jgi:hypothetical protein
MKNKFGKTLMAFAVSAACALGANTASAAVFNQFEINPTGTQANFTADKLIGDYSEIITFTENPGGTVDAGTGTFTASIKFQASSFVATGGATLDAIRTGLGSDYRLYALYNASGTFTRSGGAAIFNVTPNDGNIKMFLDQGMDTNFTIDTEAFGISGNGTDIELANGLALAGAGSLTGPSPTCGNGVGIFCGFASSTTEFNLTPQGKLFFVAPIPFYNMSFQSGQLDNFDPTGRQFLTGSLDVVFTSAQIPEPASIALLGLGLVGLGLSSRRSKKA